MGIFEDVIGESEDHGAISARTKSYTAADIDFLLKKKVGCVSELPTANESSLGAVMLLTESQTGYTKMHFYKCVQSGSSYSWVDINADLPVCNCTNITSVRMDGGATCAIQWTDPSDQAAQVIDSYHSIAGFTWDHTVLVRNSSHVPESVDDGTVVVTSSVRNQFSSTPYLDAGLDANIVTYYYKLFPVDASGSVVSSSANAFSPTEPTWNELSGIIQSGNGLQFLPRGSTITVAHKDFGNIEFEVIGDETIGNDSTDETAKIKIAETGVNHCLVLMSKYVLEGTKQFDASETQYGLTMDVEFQSGKTYYTTDGSTYSVATVTVGDTIPAETYYEANKNANYSNGTNGWDLSGIRQWLNAITLAGNWWVKKHACDVKPDYADTVDGFLGGFTDTDFVSKICTLTNTTEISPIYGGGPVDTEDKIWFGSYKQMMDSGSFGYTANAQRNKTYYGQTTGVIYWLRSPNDSHVHYVRTVGRSGGFSGYGSGARTARGVVPCLAIK